MAFATNLDLYNMNFKMPLNEKMKKVSIVSQESEADWVSAQVFL